MPNFSYTASKAWTPYTFEEILKPLAMYTEEYNKLEDALANISTKAEMLRRLALEAGGKVADVYNSYANELDELATLLTKYGLSPSTRASIKNLLKLYASNIVPIEDAIKYKKAIADELRKLRALDSSIMFDRDYSTVNLNDIYDNPELGYQAISGNDLYKQVALSAGTLAKEILSNPIKWKKILGDQYFEAIIQKGIPSDIISKFLYNADDIIYNNLDPETVGIPLELSSKLQEILEVPLASSGIRNWKNNMSKSDWKALVPRVNNYVRRGLWSAVGDAQYQNQANRNFESDSAELDRKYKLALLDEKREEREAKLYGLKLPNGDYVKDIRGGKVRIIHPNNPPETMIEILSGDRAKGLLSGIKDASKITDKPVIVAYTNGKWRIGEEEKDVPKTAWGMTRSNAVSTWGDYTLDNVSSDNIVTDYSEIPTEALDKLKKAFKDYNLDEKLYAIVRVKAEKSRAAGDYDYVLMPISQLPALLNLNSTSTLTGVPYRLPEQGSGTSSNFSPDSLL